MDTSTSALATGMAAWGIGIWILVIGIIFALPMIWYHVGHISRKLSRIIELLERADKNLDQPISNSQLDAVEPMKDSKFVSPKVTALVFGVILIFIFGLWYWCSHIMKL